MGGNSSTACGPPTKFCCNDSFELNKTGGKVSASKQNRVLEKFAPLADDYFIPRGSTSTTLLLTSSKKFYLARHRKLDQWFVVKEALKNERAKACWERDTAVMLELDHPNACKLYELYTYESHRYQIQELCDGKSLYGFCQARRLNEDNSAWLVRQALSAIGHLHSMGYCHLELVLSSFMLTQLHRRSPFIQDLHIKLIDIGQAQLVSAPVQVESGTLQGERAKTVAPEQSRLDVTNPGGDCCDLYSIGVFAFFALTNSWPEIRSEKITAQTESSTRDWLGVSPNGKQFIENSLLGPAEARPKAATLLESNPWLAAGHAAYLSALQKDDDHIRRRARGKSLAAADGRDASMTAEAIVKAFRALAELDPLQRAVIATAVHRLPDHKTAHFRRIFLKYDNDGNGTLSVEELVEGLGEAMVDLGKVEIMSILDRIDLDGSRCIDYTEFVTALFVCEGRASIGDDLCTMCFSLFDKDDTGDMSLKEVMHMFNIDGESLISQNTEHRFDSQALIAKYDRDGNGVICIDEFKRILRGELVAAEAEDTDGGLPSSRVEDSSRKRSRRDSVTSNSSGGAMGKSQKGKERRSPRASMKADRIDSMLANAQGADEWMRASSLPPQQSAFRNESRSPRRDCKERQKRLEEFVREGAASTGEQRWETAPAACGADEAVKCPQSPSNSPGKFVSGMAAKLKKAVTKTLHIDTELAEPTEQLGSLDTASNSSPQGSVLSRVAKGAKDAKDQLKQGSALLFSPKQVAPARHPRSPGARKASRD